MGSLKPHLRASGAAMDMVDKLTMMAQCSAALSFVHRNNIVHRDLAIRNVLLYSLAPVLVKLSDFGCQ
jgi:serine/threonine protein kinase